ncbi:Gfo/Idh/MocA family oxidoreductase [Rubrivirga sp. S365]|uniref:Gfo/Idh/MocA family oxidoreductase n=1 Tax=Rubrivirga litoralis TaxID=3075598 RepID=A0ABU3BTJ3_9BACT|nr:MULTISPECIES: Gfo/Idh/MocA family oxidoreductase [unclassified Rubrivirga]MDT0632613.1 Gfo/Idh/MocA family oxidoreductase [Rubrivirga sp. F394]MDT7855435.1 Gfo/Idh/MocA family oxidoreductase [Rubrivirga sp. S365]
METTDTATTPRPAPPAGRPRLGFLGVGWIGRNRMEAIVQSGAAEVVAVSDPSSEAVAAAQEAAPGAEAAADLDALLALDLDGVVIATPSAMHAAQSVAALERGVAVFCQKPLARSAAEARRVVDAARAADRPLGVDLSYRRVAGVPEIRNLVQGGALGSVYAVDLTFHNAYGPDKAWFYDAERSGGGCVMDLGVHLVDLALWALDYPDVEAVQSALYSGGERLPLPVDRVEDYALATLDLAGGAASAAGATVRLACSWNAPAGQDAAIEATVYGTEGGARLANVDGSFYDFTAERLQGTARETIAAPPDDWGGRAAVAWAEGLAAGAGFDPEAERLVALHDVLDWIYGRPRTERP